MAKNLGGTMDLKSKIRVIDNFPKEGISYKDITTLLNDKDAYRTAINAMKEDLKGRDVNVIVGPEARGFVFGSALAYAMNCRFVPVRKPGKLPSETASFRYGLEYGFDELEIHDDAICSGDRVAIVDDLLATGGTVNAACKLIEQQGGKVVAMEFLIELEQLKGREKNKDYYINSLVKYDY